MFLFSTTSTRKNSFTESSNRPSAPISLVFFEMLYKSLCILFKSMLLRKRGKYLNAEGMVRKVAVIDSINSRSGLNHWSLERFELSPLSNCQFLYSVFFCSFSRPRAADGR